MVPVFRSALQLCGGVGGGTETGQLVVRDREGGEVGCVVGAAAAGFGSGRACLIEPLSALGVAETRCACDLRQRGAAAARDEGIPPDWR